MEKEEERYPDGETPSGVATAGNGGGNGDPEGGKYREGSRVKCNKNGGVGFGGAEEKGAFVTC